MREAKCAGVTYSFKHLLIVPKKSKNSCNSKMQDLSAEARTIDYCMQECDESSKARLQV